ncbi:MAG: hypothetical protein ACO4B3_11400 [Planctomycetota bacterium]
MCRSKSCWSRHSKGLSGAAKKALEGHGRILLRYSGTEPLARVLVEGRDAEENADWAERIADSLRTDRALASPGEPQGEPRD